MPEKLVIGFPFLSSLGPGNRLTYGFTRLGSTEPASLDIMYVIKHLPAYNSLKGSLFHHWHKESEHQVLFPFWIELDFKSLRTVIRV